MNKNKKLISLVAAIAMVFTMLSSFTFVSAAGEAFKLSEPVFHEDTNTITFDVSFTGVEGGVGSGKFVIGNLPAEVTDAKTAAEPYSFKKDKNQLSYSFMYGGAATTDPERVITTVTLTVNNGESGLSSAAELKVTDGYLDPNSGSQLTFENGLTSNTVTLPADPHAPVVSTAEPKAVDDSKAPEADKTTSAAGYKFDNLQRNADGTQYTFDVYYTNVEGGAGSGKFVIALPATVTDAKTAAEPYSFKKDKQQLSYSYMYGGAATTDSERLITTVTLTCDPALKTDEQIKFADGYIDPNSGSQIVITDANTSTITLKAIEKTPEDTLKLQDAVNKGEDKDVTVTDTPTNGESEYFIDLKVTKPDENDPTQQVKADYGTDYVAAIGDTNLTEGQLSNLLNGHLDADNVKDIVKDNDIKDINDVIKKINFKLYNENMKVAAPLVNKTSKVVANGEEKAVSADDVKDSGDSGNNNKNETHVKYAVTAKKGNATVKSGTSTKLNSGDKIVLTPNFTKGQSAEGVAYTQTGATTVSATAATFSGVATPGIKITYKTVVPATADEDEKTVENEEYLTITQKSFEVPAGATDLAVEFTAYNASTTDTQAIEITFETTSNDPDNATPSDKFEATVNKYTSGNGGNGGNGGSGSSDDNKSSGGNVIATGNQNVINGGSVIGGGFTDLNDAPWASAAITALAADGIVSGRGDGTFDPNANITRAEYCQILINAINKSNEYADASFNDVPTDAWFYHAVAVASKYGIVSGYGDGNFGPYDLITREQMALMTQKAAQVMNVNLSATTSASFSDDAAIADWSRGAVYELANAGIINGMDDGTFAPKANATRAQAAVIIYSTFIAK